MKLSTTDIANINLLGEFCGPRDIKSLTQTELKQQFGIKQADVYVLFGGSILSGVDILAQAIQNHIAKKYLIVGGYGHTTATLQQTVITKYPDIPAKQMQEAEIFAALLKKRFNLQPDLLETKSTNCGNNITYLLALLKENKINFTSIILSQDATMQRRMSACLRKYVGTDVKVINYATYQTDLIQHQDDLEFMPPVIDMWCPERYLTLLMGEIPRLTDDEHGYGPLGKRFISHIEIPQDILRAYKDLHDKYPDINRPSNSKYSF
ncbi:ElyC/SanA/YdcF family protein [Companilactobacillus kimchiensis]|uniref:DUF218 domain-containing protein n=1 Tax=Companilactobacillus kimchiensis TaxID=993692 RepID=A0A0R2LD99_9LACO|nr:ElyC/SanA/YdcF family protein [Companilactobacillus kimchiensis]KRN99874.1 hypothetical protein IV57_GL002206 [Companilactobacillus kimchiensis]